MSHVWLGSGIVAAGLAMFFALAGHALRRFSRARLEEALERRGRAEELGRLFAHHDDLVRTTALLHVLALVAWTATAILWASAEFGTPLGWLVGVILAAAGAVSLGGVLPMAWARYAPESVLAATLPALHACRLAFQPAARLLGILDGLVRRLAGVPGGPGSARAKPGFAEATPGAPGSAGGWNRTEANSSGCGRRISPGRTAPNSCRATCST